MSTPLHDAAGRALVVLAALHLAVQWELAPEIREEIGAIVPELSDALLRDRGPVGTAEGEAIAGPPGRSVSAEPPLYVVTCEDYFGPLFFVKGAFPTRQLALDQWQAIGPYLRPDYHVYECRGADCEDITPATDPLGEAV